MVRQVQALERSHPRGDDGQCERQPPGELGDPLRARGSSSTRAAPDLGAQQVEGRLERQHTDGQADGQGALASVAAWSPASRWSACSAGEAPPGRRRPRRRGPSATAAGPPLAAAVGSAFEPEHGHLAPRSRPGSAGPGPAPPRDRPAGGRGWCPRRSTHCTSGWTPGRLMTECAKVVANRVFPTPPIPSRTMTTGDFPVASSRMAPEVAELRVPPDRRGRLGRRVIRDGHDAGSVPAVATTSHAWRQRTVSSRPPRSAVTMSTTSSGSTPVRPGCRQRWTVSNAGSSGTPRLRRAPVTRRWSSR